MQVRKSSRTVKKPKTYDVDDDPDYQTEEDDDSHDQYEPTRKPAPCKRRLSSHDPTGLDDSYTEKREKNNVAVRKSRMKLKVKQDEAVQAIDVMGSKREQMEEDVTHLATEITQLKDLLYQITSSQSGIRNGPIDLTNLRYYEYMK
jgi:CCAAT/enhancer binding protein (C/EBP) gamma